MSDTPVDVEVDVELRSNDMLLKVFELAVLSSQHKFTLRGCEEIIKILC